MLALYFVQRSARGRCCCLVKFGKIGFERCLGEAYRENINKHNQIAQKNRYILSGLTDAVCYLGAQNIAFRGNYVELLNVFAQQDEKLSHLLNTSTVFSEHSKVIQNDLILAISSVIIDKIKSEIERSLFTAIIIDESIDVSNKSLLLTVVRYVLPENAEVQERFIKFHVSSNRSATQLAEYFFECIKEFNIGNKLVAQTCNGAAVAAGRRGGLQNIVKEKYAQAVFVHCYTHRLNFVLSQSVEHIRDCKIFFQTIAGLASFFSESSNRSDSLNGVVHRRLRGVAPIRWKCNSRLVEVVSSIKNELEEVFANMVENPDERDGETRACATGFNENLKKL